MIDVQASYLRPNKNIFVTGNCQWLSKFNQYRHELGKTFSHLVITLRLQQRSNDRKIIFFEN